MSTLARPSLPVLSHASSGKGSVLRRLVAVSALTLAVLVSPGPAFGAASQPPTVKTGAAGVVTATAATVNGSITTNGTGISQYRFDYNTTGNFTGGIVPSYQSTTAKPFDPVKEPIPGDALQPLAPTTHYYFRLVALARNANGGYTEYPAANVSTFDTPVQLVPTPRLNIDDVSVKEGNSGFTNMTFTVSLTGLARESVEFHARTADGPAQARLGTPFGDFAGISVHGSIPSGKTSTTVTVPVRGDVAAEPDETFFVDLEINSGADPGDMRGTGTILDDDTVGGAAMFTYAMSWGKEGLAPGLFGTGREVHGGDRQYDDPAQIQIIGPAAGASSASAPVIFAVDPSNNRIQKFALDGSFMGTFGSEGFDPGASNHVAAKGRYQLPIGLAVDSAGHLFIADARNDRVIETTQSGKFIRRIGRRGAGRARFVFPNSLAVLGSTLFVVDRANTRIQKWTTTGRYLGTIGHFGNDAGGLLYPSDIKAHNGEIYVTDAMKNQVMVFAPSGRFVRSFGSTGRGVGQLVVASGLAFTKDGNVLVGDRCNKRIDAFDPNGKPLGAIGQGLLHTPTYMTTDASGNLFVSDYRRIVKFAANTPVQAAAFHDGGASSSTGSGAADSPRASSAGETASPAASGHIAGPSYDIICRAEPRALHRQRFGGVSVKSHKVGLDFSGNAYVRSYCAGLTYWACQGTITITYKGRKVGSAPITVGSNDAPTVIVGLPRRIRSLVFAKHRVPARVTYRVHDNQVQTQYRTTSFKVFLTR